jgi:hypothetical protein
MINTWRQARDLSPRLLLFRHNKVCFLPYPFAFQTIAVTVGAGSLHREVETVTTKNLLFVGRSIKKRSLLCQEDFGHKMWDAAWMPLLKAHSDIRPLKKFLIELSGKED